MKFKHTKIIAGTSSVILSIIVSASAFAASFNVSLSGENTFETSTTLSLSINNISGFPAEDGGLSAIQGILVYDSSKITVEAVASSGFLLFDGSPTVLFNANGISNGAQVMSIKVSNKALADNEATTISFNDVKGSDKNVVVNVPNASKTITRKVPGSVAPPNNDNPGSNQDKDVNTGQNQNPGQNISPSPNPNPDTGLSPNPGANLSPNPSTSTTQNPSSSQSGNSNNQNNNSSNNQGSNSSNNRNSTSSSPNNASPNTSLSNNSKPKEQDELDNNRSFDEDANKDIIEGGDDDEKTALSITTTRKNKEKLPKTESSQNDDNNNDSIAPVIIVSVVVVVIIIIAAGIVFVIKSGKFSRNEK